MAYDSGEAGELELGLFLARKLAKCPRPCAEGEKKKKAICEKSKPHFCYLYRVYQHS